MLVKYIVRCVVVGDVSKTQKICLRLTLRETVKTGVGLDVLFDLR